MPPSAQMAVDVGLVARGLVELVLTLVLLAAMLRRGSDRWVRRLAFASFALRVVLGEALFFISLLGLPLA